MPYEETTAAGQLALDIVRQGYHQPLVNGKANRDRIENQLVVSVYRNEIPYMLTQSLVDLAIDTIDDLIETYGTTSGRDSDI